jgi:hypothetical protein
MGASPPNRVPPHGGIQTTEKDVSMGAVRLRENGPISGAGKRALQVIALLSALTASIPMSGAVAATVRARYSVSYLGVPLGEITIVNTVEPSAYEARLDAHTTGAASVARSFRISMKANGIMRNAAILPTSFSSRQSGAESRTMRISLAAGDAKAAEIDPPFEGAGPLVPMTEDHKRSVVDPLSALIMPLSPDDRGLGPSACDRTLRLFTGIARSDLKFAYARTEQLKSKAYSGDVAVCSVRYLPIAGHNPDSTMTKFMVANRGIEARLAPLQDASLVMLVSATVPLPLGTAMVALEQYEVVPTLVGSNR